MSRRKLSKQQKRRISERQRQSEQNAKQNAEPEFDESSLGPEQGGQIITHFGNQADVENTADKCVTRCHLRANIGNIVVGDRVTWRNHGDDEGVVIAVDKRDRELYRPDSFGKLKLVAANVSRVCIVIAPEPEPFANLIDRYLVAAENSGLAVNLVLNKSDLITQNHDFFEALLCKYKQLGYKSFETSTVTGNGLNQLADTLKNDCSIFVGQSGVGKSSIIHYMLPNETIKIGELSGGEKKGRHTTTYARLYHFEAGGDCIDSPGIREFGLWHLSAKDVEHAFVEFRPFIGQCKFRDCKHINEPGCALKEALASGDIRADRFESFRQIVDSLEQVQMVDGGN